jgi:hypothetical protein
MGIVRHLFEREFAAHGLKQCRIQAAGEPEKTIRDPSLTAQQGGHCRQYRIESPGHLSRYCWSGLCPDQTPARIVAHLRVRIQDGVLQILKSSII